MTVEEAIFDIIEIKNAFGDDTDLDEMFLLQKLNSYRELLINAQYQLTAHIDYTWLQRHPQFTWEKITAADDPNVTIGSITLGKYTLPGIVTLPEDLGLYQVMGSGGIRLYSKDDFATMMTRAEIKEERHPRHGYYSRIGNVVYSFPYEIYGQAILIAANPMDVPINTSTTTTRTMLFTDEYPASVGLIQQCILQILSKDLKISDEAVSDIINDSQEQLKIMKDGVAKQTAGSGG